MGSFFVLPKTNINVMCDKPEEIQNAAYPYGIEAPGVSPQAIARHVSRMRLRRIGEHHKKLQAVAEIGAEFPDEFVLPVTDGSKAAEEEA